MALSTEPWGARPTPWSISLLMVSRHRLSGWLLALCTASSQRACSSRSLSCGSWGSSTSRPKLMSSSSCSSSGLGDSSVRRRSLRNWKSSTRVNRSCDRQIYKGEKRKQRVLGTSISYLRYNNSVHCIFFQSLKFFRLRVLRGSIKSIISLSIYVTNRCFFHNIFIKCIHSCSKNRLYVFNPNKD